MRRLYKTIGTIKFVKYQSSKEPDWRSEQSESLSVITTVTGSITNKDYIL